MGTKVEFCEFRDNLSSYLLQAEAPITITRHGDTVGHYYPVRPKVTQEQLAAFDEAAAKWQAEKDAAGITEDQINAIIDEHMREVKAKRHAEQ